MAGSATAISAALGVFCVCNAGLAHEWRVCGFPSACNYQGNESVSPLPTTSVGLPNGAMLGIGLYAGIVFGCGALLAVAALACAERPGPGPRLVVWTMAALLALSLVCFRLPPPARLIGMMDPCITTNSCPMQVSLYPSPIASGWYVTPSAVLGLLTAVLSLLPLRLPALVAQPSNRQ